jgi:hypothetical protein
MKKLLVVAMAFMLTIAASYAGCGKKVNNTGKLNSFKAESKQVVIEEKGKKVKLKITPSTKFFASEGGSEVSIDKLLGKNVKVVSEHKKIDSITGA